MPWIGPDKRSLRRFALERLMGTLRATAFLPAVFLRLRPVAAAFLVLTAFFLAIFFLATGFFFVTVFLLARFFTGDFAAARFLDARLFAADFLATAFLFVTFFFRADFFAAGFFRATDFFLDDFFADTFFLLTVLFLVTGFFLVDGLLLAAFFREAFAGLRFLLAVFFAGIVNSYRSEKNAQLYIACRHMEARISRFFCGGGCTAGQRLAEPSQRLADGPQTVIFSAFRRALSAAREHRFMPGIPLHYTEFSGMGVTPANAT